jgi:VIT family
MSSPRSTRRVALLARWPSKSPWRCTRTTPCKAHLRDQLGHRESTKARPQLAAGAPAASFTIGGLVPFLRILATSQGTWLVLIVAVTIVSLPVAGVLGARAAGRDPAASHDASPYWRYCSDDRNGLNRANLECLRSLAPAGEERPDGVR